MQSMPITAQAGSDQYGLVSEFGNHQEDGSRRFQMKRPRAYVYLYSLVYVPHSYHHNICSKGMSCDRVCCNYCVCVCVSLASSTPTCCQRERQECPAARLRTSMKSLAACTSETICTLMSTCQWCLHMPLDAQRSLLRYCQAS